MCKSCTWIGGLVGGFVEADDEMKELVKDMQLDDLQRDMVASVHGSYKMWTLFKVKRFV
jgi:hypothetical protein